MLLTEPTCFSLHRNPPACTEPMYHILQNTLWAPVKLRPRTQKWDQKNNCLSKGCRPTATEKHPCGITNALLLLLCPLVLFTVGSFTQEGMASLGTVFKSPHPSTNFFLSFPLNNWISKGSWVTLIEGENFIWDTVSFDELYRLDLKPKLSNSTFVKDYWNIMQHRKSLPFSQLQKLKYNL